MAIYDQVVKLILKGAKYVDGIDWNAFKQFGVTEEKIAEKVEKGVPLNSAEKMYLFDKIVNDPDEGVKGLIWDKDNGKYILNPERMKDVAQETLTKSWEKYQLTDKEIDDLSGMIETFYRTVKEQKYKDQYKSDPRWTQKDLQKRKAYRNGLKKKAQAVYNEDLTIDTKIIANLAKNISRFNVSDFSDMRDVEAFVWGQFGTMERLLAGLDETMLDADSLREFSNTTGWADLFKWIINHNPHASDFNGWQNSGQTIMGSIVYWSAKKELDDLVALVRSGKPAEEFKKAKDADPLELTKAKLLVTIEAFHEIFPSVSVARSASGSQLRYNMSEDVIQNYKKIYQSTLDPDAANTGDTARKITDLFDRFGMNSMNVEEFAEEYFQLSNVEKAPLLNRLRAWWETPGIRNKYRDSYVGDFSKWLKQNLSMNALTGWQTFGKAFVNAGLISQAVMPMTKTTASMLVAPMEKTAGRVALWGNDVYRGMTGTDILSDNVKIKIMDNDADSADLTDILVFYQAQRDSINNVWRSVKSQIRNFGKLSPDQKLELTQNRDINYEISEWLSKQGKGGEIASVLPKYWMNHSGAVLQGIDRMYQGISMSRSLYVKAYHESIKAFQKTGDIAEARNVFMKYMTEPTSYVDEAKIMAEAETLTGRVVAGEKKQKSTNIATSIATAPLKLGEDLIEKAYRVGADNLFVKSVMLFPRIWLKIMGVQKDFIPGGMVLSRKNREIMMAGGAARQELIAKQIIGAEIMASVHDLACNISANDQLFCITNSLSDDQETKDMQTAMGLTDFAINFRPTVDDKFTSVPTELLTPLNGPLHMGVWLGEVLRADAVDDPLPLLATAIDGFVEFLTMDQLFVIDDTIRDIGTNLVNLASESLDSKQKAINNLVTIGTEFGLVYKGAFNNIFPTTTDGLNKFFTRLTDSTVRSNKPIYVNQVYEDTWQGRISEAWDKSRVKDANARGWQESIPGVLDPVLDPFNLKEKRGYPVYNSKGEKQNVGLYPFDTPQEVLMGTGIIIGDELTDKDKLTQKTVNSLVADGISLPKSYHSTLKNVRLNNKEQFDFSNYIFNTPREYRGADGELLFPDRGAMTLYDTLNAIVSEENDVSALYKTKLTRGEHIGYTGAKLKATKEAQIEDVYKQYLEYAEQDMRSDPGFDNKVTIAESFMENK